METEYEGHQGVSSWREGKKRKKRRSVVGVGVGFEDRSKKGFSQKGKTAAPVAE